MSETPPEDPADHAVEFGRRWADEFDRYAAERMEELGIPPEQIGAPDYERGVPWRTFFPDEKEGGAVSPGGRLNLDSGVLNPDRMRHLGPAAAAAWSRARLRDRIDAAIAHEFEEARHGTHEEATEQAPATALPVRPASRRLLRTIRDAERQRRASRPSLPNPPP